MTKHENHQIPVLKRALTILDYLANHPQDRTIKGMAYELGIPHTTCYRIVQTLVGHNWLRPEAHGNYNIALGLIPLFETITHQRVLLEYLKAPCDELAEATGLSAKVSMPQGDYVTTLYYAMPQRPTALASKLGFSNHLCIGSTGTACLYTRSDDEIHRIIKTADASTWEHQDQKELWKRIHQLRDKGYCLDTGSYSPEVCAMSAPILQTGNQIAAVITIMGFPKDFYGDIRETLGPTLIQKASECSNIIAKTTDS